MGELRRLSHSMIDHDQKIQRLESLDGVYLIWPRHRRVASGDNEGAYLALARCQDFFSQSVRQHFVWHAGKASDSMWCAAVGSSRRDHPGTTGVAGREEVPGFKCVAWLVDPSAENVQGQRQMLGQHCPGCHVGPRAGAGRTAGSRGEQLCSGLDVGAVHPCLLSGALQVKWVDQRAQTFEAVDVSAAELGVVHLAIDYQPDHCSQKRRILTGADLKPKVSGTSQLGSPGSTTISRSPRAFACLSFTTGSVPCRPPAGPYDETMVL